MGNHHVPAISKNIPDIPLYVIAWNLRWKQITTPGIPTLLPESFPDYAAEFTGYKNAFHVPLTCHTTTHPATLNEKECCYYTTLFQLDIPPTKAGNVPTISSLVNPSPPTLQKNKLDVLLVIPSPVPLPMRLQLDFTRCVANRTGTLRHYRLCHVFPRKPWVAEVAVVSERLLGLQGMLRCARNA